MPSLSEELVQTYTIAGRTLADLLQRLADSPPREKVILYNQILRILDRLKSETNDKGRELIEEFYREADEKAIAVLSQRISDDQLFKEWTQVHEGAVTATLTYMTEKLNRGIDSIKTVAASVFRQTGLETALENETRKAIVQGLVLGGGNRQVTSPLVKEVLTRTFKDGVVKVLAQNGRTYKYRMGYYADLLTHNMTREAMTQATLMRASENNWDLVRISTNPSTMDDCYCNAYRGRVFSISGTSERFPPLASLPNGGPPFHPWCRHTASIFIPDFYSSSALDEFADTPESLLLGPEDDQSRAPNTLLRRYLELKKSMANLGTLKNV